MSERVVTVSQKKNVANYRFGQQFDFEKIRFMWRRTPYAHRLVVDVVNDAIGKGFNVKYADGDVVEKNEQIRMKLKEHWKNIKKVIFYQRAYGGGLGKYYKKKTSEIYMAFDEYFASYDKFGDATKFSVMYKIGGTTPTFESKDIIDGELKDVFELIVDEGGRIGDGISILEPVWDTLFSLMMLDENGTYFAIRYGAGIRYLKIPQAKLGDRVYMGKLMAMMNGAIGVNGLFTLPYSTIGGVKEEIEISTETPIQISFLDLRDLLLGSLSAQTGIPREVFLGSQTGLRSSEKNEDRYFDYLQNIQDMYREYFEWHVYRLNKKYKWFPEGKMIELDYDKREVLSDDEALELFSKQCDIIVKAGFRVPKGKLEEMIGFTVEEKQEEILDEEIPEKILDEKQEEIKKDLKEKTD